MSEREKLLEEVKKYIRSVVISIQNGLPLSQLDIDYKNMVGQNIPFRDLGYNDILDFVKDIPDVVTTNWSQESRDYWITAVASKEIKHIEKLVQRQKSRTKKVKPVVFCGNYASRYAKRRSYNPPRFQESSKDLRQSVLAPLEARIRSLLADHPRGLRLSMLEHEYMQKYGYSLNYSDHGFYSLENLLQLVNGIRFEKQFSEMKVYLTRVDPKEGYLNKDLPRCNFSQLNTGHPKNIYLPFKSDSTPGNSLPIIGERDISSHDNRKYICDKMKSTEFKELDGISFEEKHRNETCSQSTDLIRNRIFKEKGEILSSSGAKVQSIHCQSNKSVNLQDPFDDFVPVSNKSSINIPNKKDENFSCDISRSLPYQANKSKMCDTLDDFSSFMPDSLSRSTSSGTSTSCTSSSDNCSLSHEMDINSNDFVSDTLKDEFRQILEKYPSGIWAANFPTIYQKILGKELDLKGIGYYSLTDLLNALHDVVITERPHGSMGDWLIRDIRRWSPTRDVRKTYFCAGQPTCITNLDISEETKFSIIKLLQGFPDGILLEELDTIYEENCGEPLPWIQLGFYNVKEFVVALSKVMPLILEKGKGALIVKLKDDKQPSKIYYKDSTPSPVISYPKCFVNMTVQLPSDAVDPAASFTSQALPPNLEPNKFIGVFVSHVDTPGQIWFQLSDGSNELEHLMDELENVYCSMLSTERYKMPESKIIIGNICVALWPGDNNWHRVKICSIPGVNIVEVFYVDYGSKAKVSTSDLRLLRKDFLALPAQAIKAKLLSIRPPNKEKLWSKESCQRLLQMCKDKRLMALVKIFEETVAICLCDTTGEKDLHINDQLVEEGYAVFDQLDDKKVQPDATSFSIFGTPYPQAALNPNQFTSAENNAIWQNILLQALIRMSNVNLNQSPDVSSLVSLASNSISDDAKNSRSQAHSSLPSSVAKMNLISSSQNILEPQNSPTASDTITTFKTKFSPTSSKRKVGEVLPRIQESFRTEESDVDSDDEVLGDEDDELIRQLCDNLDKPQNQTIKHMDHGEENKVMHSFFEKEKPQNKYIKRLHLKDSYKINIINHKNMPYVTDGDVSSLFWNRDNPQMLNMRLRMKCLKLSPVVICRKDNENLFAEMLKYKIKGIKENTNNVTLYPLHNVITIVDDFGHPSLKLLEELSEELISFDPSSEDWKLHDRDYNIEEDKASSDDSDIMRLCHDDLLYLNIALKNNRFTIINKISNTKNPEELDAHVEKLKNIDVQIEKVEERIEDLKQQKAYEIFRASLVATCQANKNSKFASKEASLGIEHQHEVIPGMTAGSTLRRASGSPQHFHFQEWTSKR